MNSKFESQALSLDSKLDSQTKFISGQLQPLSDKTDVIAKNVEGLKSVLSELTTNFDLANKWIDNLETGLVKASQIARYTQNRVESVKQLVSSVNQSSKELESRADELMDFKNTASISIEALKKKLNTNNNNNANINLTNNSNCSNLDLFDQTCYN